MKITRREIRDAILGDDVRKVAEMLEEFDLSKDGTPPPFHSFKQEISN